MRKTVLAKAAILSILGLTALPTGCKQRPISLVKAAGNEAYAAGDFAEARANYAEWAQRERANAEAQYNYGRALLAEGRPTSAREALELAFRLEPSNTRYLDALIDVMIETGEVDALFQLLRQRAEDEQTGAGYLRLARASARAGLADEAVQAYRQAIALEPGSPTVRRAAADFYRSIGDQAGEISQLRVLLGLDPNDPYAANRLRELGHVPGPSFALPPGTEGR